VIFIRELFGAGDDPDERAAVRAVPDDGLDLAGPALPGPRSARDRVLEGGRPAPPGRR